MTKILLADEEKDIRDFITRFFSERNFEVSNAANGIDTLLAIKKERPDIVLLELKMHDMDGIELLKRIRRMKQNTKVIVVTGLNDIEIMNEAKRLGVISYLIKPIVLNNLMDIILKNLGRRRRFFKLKRASGNVQYQR